MNQTIIRFYLALVMGFASNLIAQEPYFNPVPIIEYQTDSTLVLDTVYFHDQYLWAGHQDRIEFFIYFEHHGQSFMFGSNEIGSPDSLFLRDVTGDGYPEIFATINFRTGHSGWYGGLSESMSSLIVYDIKRKLVILSEELSYINQMWTNNLKTPIDSLGLNEDPIILESITDYDCFHFKFKIDKQTITIFPVGTDDCPLDYTLEGTGMTT